MERPHVPAFQSKITGVSQDGPAPWVQLLSIGGGRPEGSVGPTPLAISSPSLPSATSTHQISGQKDSKRDE